MKSAKIIGRERARLDMFFFFCMMKFKLKEYPIHILHESYNLTLSPISVNVRIQNAATGEGINFHRKPYKKEEIINGFTWLNSKIICF